MLLNLEIKYFLFFLPVIQALGSKQEAIFSEYAYHILRFANITTIYFNHIVNLSGLNVLVTCRFLFNFLPVALINESDATFLNAESIS